ncbi:MAG: pyridoxal-phosphate dependent enzyme [Tateyamaria sp.]
MKHIARADTLAASLVSELSSVPLPSANAGAPSAMLARCPRAGRTPLVTSAHLAEITGVAEVTLKDERNRMGLGSFKALGAAYVIAQDASAGTVRNRTYVTASAGNHGLSVAAGAQAFGARAVVYLADTVPDAFANRLAEHGADVRRQGPVYEDSMAEAARVAEENGWTLLSDSSWPGYLDIPHRLMEGYTVLMQEAASDMAPPTHIFLQAGVGGLAAACAAYAREVWGEQPRIVVVEPDAAPALFESVKLGAPATTTGPASDMGRLDCKEPSLIALRGLARDANDYILISEHEGARGAAVAAEADLATTPSGAAGLSGLLAASDHRDALGLSPSSRVLLILSEEMPT